MISVKYSLRDKRAKRKSTIRTSVSFSGNRIVFCPGYSIIPEHWDTKIGLPKSVKGSVEVKSTTTNLKELDLKIRHLYDDLSLNGKQKVSLEIFKNKILQLAHPENTAGENTRQMTLIDFFDQTIKDIEQGKRLKGDEYQLEENSIKPYRTARLHFFNFQKKVGKIFLLTDMNQNLHDEFSDYLIMDLDFAKNTHSKYIMALYQVIKYAVKKKLLSGSVLHEIKFKTTREETDAIFLDESEIQLLLNLKDIQSGTEETVRDLFVLGCYTGLRFSNYSNINLDYLDDKFLTTVQIKTKQKVTIPIHPNARMIFDKYKDGLPVCPTNQEFNRTLKDISQRIKEFHAPFTKLITRNRHITEEEKMKWELVQSHTARRSFCTNMYLDGVEMLSIMAISGHKTEKSFRRYIKADALQHAELIRKHWENNTKKEVKKDPEKS